LLAKLAVHTFGRTVGVFGCSLTLIAHSAEVCTAKKCLLRRTPKDEGWRVSSPAAPARCCAASEELAATEAAAAAVLPIAASAAAARRLGSGRRLGAPAGESGGNLG